jgi:hypothetical protein
MSNPVLSTREAAEALGTTPKVLRQFLRQDSIGGVGSGARYEIKQKHIKALRRRFEEWVGDRALITRVTVDTDTPGLPITILTTRSRATDNMVRQLSHDRVDRLEAALRARGLHVSQMNDSRLGVSA